MLPTHEEADKLMEPGGGWPCGAAPQQEGCQEPEVPREQLCPHEEASCQLGYMI